MLSIFFGWFFACLVELSEVENIRRFGGSTSPAMPWPNEDHSSGDGAEDKLDRLEKIILRATKRLADR